MRRRWWGTGAVVAAAVCGTLVVQGVGGNSGDDAKSDAGPVRGHVRSAGLKLSGDGRAARLVQRGAEPFSMLGVSWQKPSARLVGKVEVRSRSVRSGTWSSWMPVDADSGAGPQSAARGGTEPAWVGLSDAAEVRVEDRGVSKLPAGLRLDMISTGGHGTGTGAGGGDAEPAAYVADGPDDTADPVISDPPPPASDEPTDPTTEPAPPEASTAEPSPTDSESAPEEPSQSPADPPPATESAAPSETATEPPSPSAPVPTAPSSTVPRPVIVPRSGWNADESISPEAPAYIDGKIKAVVVHHTASTNDYTCAEAPSIINAIYAYDVTGLGWKDLGYNFVVDKCGTIYEGRKGGVDLPVVGAHAYGFNSQTTGIAVLGTYVDAPPPMAALTSVARLAAWKLGQYGVQPDATVTLTTALPGQNLAGRTWGPGEEMTLPAIHGHRDGYNTLCPGDAFYAALGTVRTLAAGPVTGLQLRTVTGTGVIGTTPYTNGPVTVTWSATTPAALVSSYEVLVDGKKAATAAGTATSAKLTLASGSHQVQIRAVHQSGRMATSTARTVVVDTTAPVFTTKPNLALRTGTVTTTAVPLTLGWKAADSVSLKETRLTAPLAKTYGPTVTSAAHTARSGAATTWALRAYDAVGNSAAASVAGTPVILQETSATRTGTWTTKSSTSYLGGRSLAAGAKNASLTWTFTGRSVAWVVSRATASGQADIYVDGKWVTTADLRSTATAYRNALWTKTWPAAAKHTLKIVVKGTAGRPTVTTDGIVYLK
ncbi:N-acetylmuramoyl-L-alanine amidase [Streptomyces sp. SID4985]|uniref:peptidoglycan recognition protein family protein n=1 Tax=Streptomyces sp. SID4985 TaxID=2690292 RepID=UPI00136D6C95|nr:peptidoglycan recognition protein [Streptomyces sp. SID4985]MYQ45075.1 N-acetylmuramoyl-L-alanine amidase [Streptomyces sp. SID4985]